MIKRFISLFFLLVFVLVLLDGQERKSKTMLFVSFKGDQYLIRQQPLFNRGWVSEEESVFTQFYSARNIGLLAHEEKFGKAIRGMKVGEKVTLYPVIGRPVTYVVKTMYIYEALEADNPYSDYIGESGERLTSTELFKKVYTGNGLTIQTCYPKNGKSRWGRYFVIAIEIKENKNEKLLRR